MRSTPSPSVRLRRLGGELRRDRAAIGYSVAHAATLAGWGPSKLSRFENAERKISVNDLDKLLDVYEVDDPKRREALHTLARESKMRGWWWKYRDVFAGRALPDFEIEASVIRTYQTVLIPGLLQTPEYAEALFRGVSYTSDDQVRRQVEARLTRREILHRIEHPPRFTAVIDEAALSRPVGGSAVMRDQLEHLLRIGQAHNISIQVVPFSAGANPGVIGPFTILDFPETTDLPIVYTDSLTSGVFEEEPEDVDLYVQTFGDIQGYALSPPQSAKFIRDVLSIES